MNLTSNEPRPLFDGALDLSKRVAFCRATDDKGFIATHNSSVSPLQSDDPDWNIAHCRNRRFFEDRAGLKAGRNRNPSQLQTDRCDPGHRNVALMREANAPTRMRDRIWGNIRLGYSV